MYRNINGVPVNNPSGQAVVKQYVLSGKYRYCYSHYSHVLTTIV